MTFSPNWLGSERTGNAITADDHFTTKDKNSTVPTSNPDDTKPPDTIPITPSPTALAVTENLKKTHTNSPRMRRLSMGR